MFSGKLLFFYYCNQGFKRRRSGGRRACCDCLIIRYHQSALGDRGRCGRMFGGSVTPFSQHESSDKIEKEKAAETSEYWKLWVPGVWTSVSFWHELVFFSIFLFSGCLRLWMLRCILLDGLFSCHRLICFYPLTPSFLWASECTSALSYSASAACWVSGGGSNPL